MPPDLPSAVFNLALPLHPWIQARHAISAVGVGPRDFACPHRLRRALVASLHNIREPRSYPAKIILYVTVGEQIDAATEIAVEVGRQYLVKGERCRYRVLVDLEYWDCRVQARRSCQRHRN